MVSSLGYIVITAGPSFSVSHTGQIFSAHCALFNVPDGLMGRDWLIALGCQTFFCLFFLAPALLMQFSHAFAGYQN
jgi:hypothetical protein